MAWGVINQKWKFYVPFFDVQFSPWRLFIVLGTLPGLIGAIAFLFLPESPKYLFSIGRRCDAIRVLSTCRGVKHSLQITDDVKLQVHRTKHYTFLESLWKQTSPLVKRKYLKTTVIICLLEFVVLFSAFGMGLWFPDIVNSIMDHIRSDKGTASLCQIYQGNVTKNITSSMCVDYFDISTYMYSIISECVCIAGYIIILLLSKHISNINLLSKYRSWFLYPPTVITSLIGTLLILSGCFGILLNFVSIPILSVYFLIGFQLTGIAVRLTVASIVQIYPTQLRAMAINLSMIFGRLGGVTGVYFTGMFIKSECELSINTIAAMIIIVSVLSLYLPKN